MTTIIQEQVFFREDLSQFPSISHIHYVVKVKGKTK